MKTFVSIVFAVILLAYDENQRSVLKEISSAQSGNKSGTMTYPVKHISVSINKPAADVYQFASNPENFPKWVLFVKTITRQGDHWLAESALGNIRVKFTPRNDFGIIDHLVTLPTGETVSNPMRVIDNNKGCEFIFTLFRRPGVTDNDFDEDVKSVSKDLQKLKEVMESERKQ
jgi:hypothetical protein